MADVTVSELAKSVGASVDRLLTQMGQAGLPHKTPGDTVSDEEKQTLLTFLKMSQGEGSAAPKKITLKRKTTTTLKTGSGSSRKTINVEVRKKRTYVKVSDNDADTGMIEASEAAEEVALPEESYVEQEQYEAMTEDSREAVAEAEETPVVEGSPPEETEAAAAPAVSASDAEAPADDTPEPARETLTRSSLVDDAEERRIRAMEARMKAQKEEEEAARRALEEKRKREQAKKEASSGTAKADTSTAKKVDPDAPAAEDDYADPRFQVPDDLVW